MSLVLKQTFLKAIQNQTCAGCKSKHFHFQKLLLQPWDLARSIDLVERIPVAGRILLYDPKTPFTSRVQVGNGISVLKVGFEDRNHQSTRSTSAQCVSDDLTFSLVEWRQLDGCELLASSSVPPIPANIRSCPPKALTFE